MSLFARLAPAVLQMEEERVGGDARSDAAPAARHDDEMMTTESEETIVPFPVPRDRVRPTTAVRSTWLASSQKAARDRGLFERYIAALPEEHRARLSSLVAAAWTPMDVAMAHYRAIDSLGLTQQEILALGRTTSDGMRGTVLSIATSLARESGVTPLTVVAQFPRFFGKAAQGGAMAVFRVGPKDARVEVVGYPCSAIPYCRVALRGVASGVLAPFAKALYVREIPQLCTNMTLGYRISWV